MRTPLRTTLLAFALVATALAGCASNNPQPPSGPGKMADIAGFSPGGPFMSQDDATIVRELDGMRRTGATWLRLDFSWSWMEPQRGTFQFSKHQKVVEWARARGIRTIALVSYTPGWAQPRDCQDTKCAPADVGDYGRFLKQLVSHFSPLGVKHYEILERAQPVLLVEAQAEPGALRVAAAGRVPGGQVGGPEHHDHRRRLRADLRQPRRALHPQHDLRQAPLRQRCPWLLRRHLDPPVLGRLPARRRGRLEHDDRGHAGDLRHDASAR